MKKTLLLILSLLLVAGIYLVFFYNDISCPIKYTFGVSCPGCGMTRAMINALFGNFEMAFYYHPLWIIMPPLAFSLLMFYYFDIRAINAALLGFCIIMLGVYFVRFFTTPEIVNFDLSATIWWNFVFP